MDLFKLTCLQRSSVSSTAPSLVDSEETKSVKSIDDAISDWNFGIGDQEADVSNQVILSLDDGGVRGYVALLVLRQLMVYVDYWERRVEEEGVGLVNVAASGKQPFVDRPSSPLSQSLSRSTTGSQRLEPLQQTSSNLANPCEYFDFIIGSGTGG